MARLSDHAVHFVGLVYCYQLGSLIRYFRKLLDLSNKTAAFRQSLLLVCLHHGFLDLIVIDLRNGGDEVNSLSSH